MIRLGAGSTQWEPATCWKEGSWSLSTLGSFILGRFCFPLPPGQCWSLWCSPAGSLGESPSRFQPWTPHPALRRGLGSGSACKIKKHQASGDSWEPTIPSWMFWLCVVTQIKILCKCQSVWIVSSVKTNVTPWSKILITSWIYNGLILLQTVLKNKNKIVKI